MKGGSNLTSQITAAKKKNTTILLPMIDVPKKNFQIPWIGYLYDFQHKHYPQYFSKKEILKRDIEFDNMLNSKKNIIVASQTVIEDAKRFFPNHTSILHSIPYSACPQESHLNIIEDLRKKYNLNKDYFLVSNQFFMHKGHNYLFKAFKKYIDLGGMHDLVCTGDTLSSSGSNYFDELKKYLRKNNLSKRIRILGHISKYDQICLLKKSKALIQPTLFEGGPGGGSVYESVGLGIPSIVSNIDVNLELQSHNIDNLVFFEFGNADDLSKKIFEAENKNFSVFSNEILLERGLARKNECGKFIYNLIKKTLEESN